MGRFQYIGTAVGACFTGLLLPPFTVTPAYPSGNSSEPLAPFAPLAPPPSHPPSSMVGAETMYRREGYQIIYFAAAAAGLLSCVFVYLARVALTSVHQGEERSAERRDGGGTTIVEVEAPGNLTGAL